MARKQKLAAAKRRRNKPRTGRWWLRLLLVTVVLGAASLAWLIWPFWQLAGQFGSEPLKQPSRLYGHPLTLSEGAVFPAKALVAHLEALGYHHRGEGEVLNPGTFAQEGDRLEIFRRRFPAAKGPAGHDLLRVTFRKDRVSGLTVADRPTRTAELDPPLIASFYGPDLRERRPVDLDELPEDLILAVLAAEDDAFLEHAGVSFTGILRAAWINLRRKSVHQGGSTLTQQLVKNIFLTHERTFWRKLREAVLAIALELRFEKRKILEAYLNEIYWGRSGNIHLMGVGAAAWAYFGKHPSQLVLQESALLAGMIRSPGRYSPLIDKDAARQRRDWVLNRLAKLRWTERARLEAAYRAPIAVADTSLVARRAPYFTDFAAAEARRRFAIDKLEDSGYVLLSTLADSDQKKAEEAIAWGVGALEEGWEKGREHRSPLEASLLSIDPADGAIRAYVGGRDYGRSQFDRVSHARRQAGSAFKPIVFAAAFAARVATPATFLEDAPLTVRLASQTWSPENSDGKYLGQVPARAVLEQSLNVPTTRLAMQVGLDQIVDLARRMGISGRLDPYPALALGAMEVTPLELATVYATLASGGQRPSLHGLTTVFDRHGRPVVGEPLQPPERVLEEPVAFLVTRVLQGVLERGTGRKARSVHGVTDPLAGKTGTTNSRRDSWFAGYSPDRATLVWVGYDDNSTTRLSGSRAALPIWSRFVWRVRPRGGFADFSQPEGVVMALIDRQTGGLATDRCSDVVSEVFLADHLPNTLCSQHSGWRARPLEQPDGLIVEDKKHPFKRWLQMLRGKRDQRRSRGGG